MLLGYLGADAAEHGHPEEAERMNKEASASAQELGDLLTDWNALNGLGALASALWHLPEAKIWFDRAIVSAQAEGNLFHEGTTRINLGFLYANLGDTATAQQIHEEVLRIIRPYGMAVGTAIQLNALGQLALRTGDLATSSGYLDEALDILEQASALDEAAQVRGNLAIVRGLMAMRQGDQAGAKEALEEALRYFETDSIPAVDQRPYVRELLADLQKQSTANNSALISDHVPASIAQTSTADPVSAAGTIHVTASRARRRWWPWGQRDPQA
jgi:tetratricopeptide (TPR) repeat protein